MLEKIKEDIDKDLPKIGRLMDEAGDDIVKKWISLCRMQHLVWRNYLVKLKKHLKISLLLVFGTYNKTINYAAKPAEW